MEGESVRDVRKRGNGGLVSLKGVRGERGEVRCDVKGGRGRMERG